MEDDNDPKGVYNISPIFKGENYNYWKVNMYVHLLSVDKNLWCVVIEGPFIPKDDGDIVKHPKDWTDGETKKASSYLKASTILISALSAKVFYSISNHISAKGMWNSLQTIYEGTYDVKDYKFNMFTEEFKIFCMEPGESMDFMQTRFFHLIKKLSNLGKTVSKKDCTNKILRSMFREWQPKITPIK